jgi:glycosyltransferase involved in cell wall biosynthesis
MPRISVVLPVFDQAAFLPMAVGSLQAQSIPDWELIVVDDGSSDDTPAVVAALDDDRIRARRLPTNSGLGQALNIGLDLARADVVAYLPADDVFDPDHLAALLAVLEDPDVVLAYSGVRHHDGQASVAAPPGFALQLVQVAHRVNAERWTDRDELESDDLDRLMWQRLRRLGRCVGTGRVTCRWTDHPGQRHKAIRERFDGGPNVFRSRYRVRSPLRLHSTDGGLVDEVDRYANARARSLPAAADGLRILLVGELSYHPDRVLALAERGHALYGLWTPDPLGIDTVGPVPFGHVTDLPAKGWVEAIRRLRPDVVYAQLNFRAVRFALEVRRAFPHLPFVWHYKEAPQRSIARGDWAELVELTASADAVVLSSPEEREWFELALPGRLHPDRMLVLDGSAPKADWFAGEPPPRLSETAGETHTLVLGRPIGFDAPFLAGLAAQRVHVHFHGLRDAPGPTGTWRSWFADAERVASGYVHVHPAVDERGWVSMLGRYDAGWMHRLGSDNHGDLRRATWDDLNYPARIGTLMAAGLPLLVPATPGHRVAVQELVRATGVGMTYAGAEHVADWLADRSAIAAARRTVAGRRMDFTFDRQVDGLLDLFHTIIGSAAA